MSSRPGIPVLPPEQRARTCDEVVGGVRAQFALAEARRCLLCHDAPCTAACPAGVDVARFIRAVRTQNHRAALRIIREGNVLAGSCARICPVAGQCEGACSSGKLKDPIAIGALQRFVADEDRRRNGRLDPAPPSTLGPVAVVGSGPAGLGCAAELARLGVAATVFDADTRAGGLLRHGIPAYRLPREVLDYEVGLIEQLGVRFLLGRRVERFDALLAEGFAAVFIAVGLGASPRLCVPGEELPGVFNWQEFLRDDWPGSMGARVVVVGGGNSAIDAAGVALRRGAAEVTVLYRRTAQEMPAFPDEVRMAREEGVRLRFLACPAAVLGGDRVEALRCRELRLGAPDESGRPRPEPVAGSEFDLPCDTVVTALGQSLAPSVAAANPVLSMARGTLAASDFRTSLDRVFAGGDAASGAGTAVRAVAEGRRAARTIHSFLAGAGTSAKETT